MSFSWIIATLTAVLTIYFFRKKRYRWFYIIARTFKRDIRALVVFSKLSFFLKLARIRNQTVVSVFDTLAKKEPQKTAFLFEEEVWTYAKLDQFSNKIARYFKNEGYQKGDCIALMLENRPEYVGIWLGLSKIGVITALINTSLINDPLVHSVKVSKSKSIIFGANYAEIVKNIEKDLALERFYQFHEVSSGESTTPSGFADLRLLLSNVSENALDSNEKVLINVEDPIILIYTSGTTGLPKAAVITHLRYLFGAWGVFFSLRLTPRDIVYTPLPLYHSAGGMLGCGQVVASGVAVALRKRFSASNYWKDCARYKCTIGQYIGEICRYILIAHKNVEPVRHSVRAIIGNGLRPQIWKEFIEKFNIKEVEELYGATEGISNLVNLDSHEGAVGFIPRYGKLIYTIYPVTLIKCDQNTGEPHRNENGHCIECDTNEPGLLIGEINKKKSVFKFSGYADKEATEKKILRNVFHDGDAYFNSGDILVFDEFGYFYFRDRTGDTFRWKGENVSTAEVEAVISNLTQLADAIVFGVEIPHSEGKAGMAALVDVNNTLDLNLLGTSLKNNLPSYAIPLFLRVLKSVPVTGTYKLKKIDLQTDGYDINKIEDAVYFYDPKLKKYDHLTKDIYDSIINGSLSL